MNKSIYRNIAVVCTLALFAMPAMAQKAVQTLSDAFDDFTGKLVKERQITMVVNNNYGDGYYQEFHFKTLLNTVKKFDETMMDNAKQAYNSFMKADGVDALGNAGLNIAYGEKTRIRAKSTTSATATTTYSSSTIPKTRTNAMPMCSCGRRTETRLRVIC